MKITILPTQCLGQKQKKTSIQKNKELLSGLHTKEKNARLLKNIENEQEHKEELNSKIQKRSQKKGKL